MLLYELKSIKGTVYTILKQNPETRNNDKKLIKEVWRKQFPGLLNMSSERLMYYLLNNKLANPESIRRNRQKLQEENENLRGYVYKMRHQAEKEFREYIKH